MIKNILGVFLLSILLSGCQGLVKKGNDTTESELANAESNTATSEINNANIGGTDTEAEGLIDSVPTVADKSGPESETEQQVDKETSQQPEVAVEPAKPLPPKDIWERIRAGYELNLDVDEPRLRSQLRWYSSHPNYLTRVSKRGERYLYFIVEELEKANLPLEIALLPIVESGFDPFGYSHGRASGPWQFIPSTGQIYGLDQNWWYDGRRDITLSTKAAIAYLTKLSRMFDGNWLHALASYNSGEGTVMRAIRKNKKAGKPTDFWSLDLPKETRAYVPKLLALAKIIKDPKKYSYETYFIANKPYFEEVNIGGQIDLAQAANMADISIDEIYLLNPGFNQWATAPDGPHRLLVPISKAKEFRTKLASITPKDRVTWVRYTVKAGDNLLGVAKSHNTTVDVLQDVNKISSSLIRVGQQLMIPVAGNKIESYTLSSHQRLLTKQSRSPSRSRTKLNYTVQAGDSLWKIAKQYNTDSKTLARWNSMGLGDPLHPGKRLVVWVKASNKATAKTNGRKSVIKKVVYTLRSGDSLARVASKFKVSLNDIRKWNPKVSSKKYVQPGDKVTLLVNVVGG
ncbi:lytic transglycosylase [Marinomonas mediterranea]|jgi:Soluble lytic murein transglycosylase and related regulatory proteins (some contain LysM/invasin domains)|uniref:Lytic transglycosylase catalytic n=1 Tax=Marinomonas mediterranea (strain ATCC 700492 / JCM 21426 / NBRC 103028 / MMB-1) TaxID=717774 RepID=F2JZV1_MARM1|nr:LysM peptidoglycan-binding domain-containing protein [Marinomonas mediterranea]ADZ92063.1 Lytic transglycosylase catalytic [Marinomonas mediterranea MMB-1]WCN10027.1 LysM peptidoglycan-binding domain-containing protein [Marinomonas mediterranea]WCN14075.1 LysM peptidoglycan-binding domain-containing protein [Marinomonas mediterranea]WCN18133.1 LysM peptidoglycan-binding domain-containing protein [Marinomonas mediterranea MMB-1]